MSAWLVTPFVDNLRVLPENGSCLQEWYDETLMPYDALWCPVMPYASRTSKCKKYSTYALLRRQGEDDIRRLSTALDKVWRFWSLSEGLCAFAFEAFAPAAWSWATQHTHCRHFVLLHRSWKTWPKMIKDHQRWHHLRELRDLSMILVWS